MEGIVFSQNSLVSLALSDSGLILFGALLVFFGAAVVLAFAVRSTPSLSLSLTAVLTILLLLLLGIVSLDLFGAQTSFYTFSETRKLSELLSTHRWLLVQLPVVTLLLSIGILLTYRDHIVDVHARRYLQIVQGSVLVSFLSVILIALESMV